MKAILVVDEMPITCMSCPFTLSNICDGAKQTLGEIMDGMKVRHESCPLKPLPCHMELETNATQTKAIKIDNSFRMGWNMCLGEILGETE